MDTIALDTTRFIAGGAAGVADTVTECHVRSREAYVRAIRRLWRFYGRRKGGKRGPNRPLAHAISPRDNCVYRASNIRTSQQDFAAVSHRHTAIIAALITL